MDCPTPASCGCRPSAILRPAPTWWNTGTGARPHNAVETYWRGLLSQDCKPNPTYEEAATIGKDLARLGPKLVNMQKHNRIAIYVSNRALTAFDAFKFGWTSKTTYNDVLRPFYDALYRMNAEVDFVDPSTTDLSALQADPRPRAVRRLRRGNRTAERIRQGGRALALHLQERLLRRECQGPLYDAAWPDRRGCRRQYNQFTLPEGVSLEGDPYHVGASENTARWWMELLTPTTATVVARYHHPVWGKYAAITRNIYGKGEVTYLGFMPSDALTEKIWKTR